MNTENERLCKKVIDSQKAMRYKNCCYNEIEDDAEKYEIDIHGITNMI